MDSNTSTVFSNPNTQRKTWEHLDLKIQTSVLLYADLPNYAEEQREAARKNMLDEVAAEAARMAEALTPPEGGDADADNMDIDSSTKVAGQQKWRVIVQRDRL